MNKIFSSSLFWFLLIGVVIFVLDAWINQPTDRVVVDDRIVTRIAYLWESQMGRAPTEEELRNLVDNWVNEEILFREAKRLGLDKEDTIVKRRLVQKMHFLAEEADVEEPDEATLRDYFSTNATRYELPKRHSFSHVFYRQEPGEDERSKLVGNAEWRGEGDATMQSSTFVQKNEREVSSEFGVRFAASLAELQASDDWQGPLQSEFGWHLVRIDAVDEAAIPEFKVVEHLVLNDYLHEARTHAKLKQLTELKDQYEVIWAVSR